MEKRDIIIGSGAALLGIAGGAAYLFYASRKQRQVQDFVPQLQNTTEPAIAPQPQNRIVVASRQIAENLKEKLTPATGKQETREEVRQENETIRHLVDRLQDVWDSLQPARKTQQQEQKTGRFKRFLRH